MQSVCRTCNSSLKLWKINFEFLTIQKNLIFQSIVHTSSLFSKTIPLKLHLGREFFFIHNLMEVIKLMRIKPPIK